MWKQLVQPDLTVVGKVAWCLSYADDVFHTPHGIPTAWKAWEATQFKHRDKSFPNVAIPVWFDYYIGKEQFGHVAVRINNGKIYSSPMTPGKPNSVFNSVEELAKFIGGVYVGWSEDISNVRVAIGGDDVEKDKQIKALQERVALMESQIKDFVRQIGGLTESIAGERKGYDALLAEYNKLKDQPAGDFVRIGELDGKEIFRRK